MQNRIPHSLGSHRSLTFEIMPMFQEENDNHPEIPYDEQGFSVCFVGDTGQVYSCQFLPQSMIVPVMMYHIQNCRYASILKVRTFYSFKEVVEPLRDNPYKELEFIFLGG